MPGLLPPPTDNLIGLSGEASIGCDVSIQLLGVDGAIRLAITGVTAAAVAASKEASKDLPLGWNGMDRGFGGVDAAGDPDKTESLGEARERCPAPVKPPSGENSRLGRGTL